MKQYLFAYGSLRQGFAPSEIADIAEKLKFVGEGFVNGDIRDLGAYKSVVSDGNGKVSGHLFEMPDDEVLQKLDEYEGFQPDNPAASLFLRKETTVFINDTEIKSWIYEYNWNA